MCDPVSLGIGIASAGLKAYGQAKASAANKAAARKAFVSEGQALVARRAEETIAGRQRIEQTGREIEAIKSRALTQAAAGNVTGISVELLKGEFEREKGETFAAMQENIRMVRKQIGRELRGAEARRESRIAAVPGPNYLALGINIASQVQTGLAEKSGRDLANRVGTEGGVNV